MKVDHCRAESGELVDIGAVAMRVCSAATESGQPERLVVLGKHDVEGLARLAEAAQLRLEYVDIDVGRGEQDRADLVGMIEAARY